MHYNYLGHNRMTRQYFEDICYYFLDSILMSSLIVSSPDESVLPSRANVKFSRVALKPGGQKSAQVC